MPKRRVRRHEVIQPLDQSYRLIPLTQGQNAIVDAEDFDRLNQWNWHAQWSNCSKTFYAGRNSYPDGPKGKCVYVRMHAEVLGIKSEIDHRDGNGFNNRKENLRPCTRKQNTWNGTKKSTNRSGFKGVSKDRRSPNGRWRARIMVSGVEIQLGLFDTPEEAAHAYNDAARRHFGDFAQVNSL
jgi:hypothetical protein